VALGYMWQAQYASSGVLVSFCFCILGACQPGPYSAHHRVLVSTFMPRRDHHGANCSTQQQRKRSSGSPDRSDTVRTTSELEASGCPGQRSPLSVRKAVARGQSQSYVSPRRLAMRTTAIWLDGVACASITNSGPPQGRLATLTAKNGRPAAAMDLGYAILYTTGGCCFGTSG